MAVLRALGVVMVLVGLFWIGQGAGFITVPSSSFMIGDMQWAYIGAGVAAAGLLLTFLARRRGA